MMNSDNGSSTKPTTVFISHNKADKDASHEIAVFLSAEGINVWFDEWNVAAGDSIVQEINTGLRGCTHFIVLWSVNASKSNWVRRELQSTLAKAIDTGSPKVIPILLDTTSLPELLSDILYIRYEEWSEENQEKIVSAILGRKPSSKFLEAMWMKYYESILSDCLKRPFKITACPNCGSYTAKVSYELNPSNYTMHLLITCESCKWSTSINGDTVKPSMVSNRNFLHNLAQQIKYLCKWFRKT